MYIVLRTLGIVLTLTLMLNVWVSPALGKGNTTCAGNALDWYTSAVGETPCMTYQRLRQICNNEYEVPSFPWEVPGDNCDDDVGDCCCNSVAWALSMLCLNCQWISNDSQLEPVDAGIMDYFRYRHVNDTGGYCGPGTNQSLPSTIEIAVCNEGIRLGNYLYELFWGTGNWYYTYTRERAGTEYAAYGNYSDHCSDEIISLVTIATSESIGLLQMPSSFTFTETATDTATHSIPTSTIMAQCSSRETTVVSHTTIDGTVTTVPFITTLAPISSTNECDFDANTGNSRRKHNAAAIAGGVIGGVTSLTFLGIMCARCVRRRQRSRGDLVAIEDTDPPEISSGPLSYTQRSSIMPVRSDEQPIAVLSHDSLMPRVVPSEKSMREQGTTVPNSSSSGFASNRMLPTSPNPGTRAPPAVSDPVHPLRGSRRRSTLPRLELAPLIAAMSAVQAARPIIQEDDAGRLTGGGIRIPPAYQREWTHDSERPRQPSS